MRFAVFVVVALVASALVVEGARRRRKAKKPITTRAPYVPTYAPATTRQPVYNPSPVYSSVEFIGIPLNLRPEVKNELLRNRVKLCYQSAEFSLAPQNLLPIKCSTNVFDTAVCSFECLDGFGTASPVTSKCIDFNGQTVHTVFGDACQDSDSDGISDATEDAAPNSGDNNNDGLLDSAQPNVASFPDPATGFYVSIETPAGTQLSEIAPVNATSDYGLFFEALGSAFTYKVSGLAPGATIAVTLHYADTNCTTGLNAVRKGCEANYTDVNATVVYNADGTCSATFEVTDGSDLDCDGAADGMILDPVVGGNDTAPEGVWVTANSESCDDACSAESLTCDAAQLNLVTDEDTLAAVMILSNSGRDISECQQVAVPGSNQDKAPYLYVDPDTSDLLCRLSDGVSSTCDSTFGSSITRMCCCTSDYFKPCPLVAPEPV